MFVHGIDKITSAASVSYNVIFSTIFYEKFPTIIYDFYWICFNE